VSQSLFKQRNLKKLKSVINPKSEIRSRISGYRHLFYLIFFLARQAKKDW